MKKKMRLILEVWKKKKRKKTNSLMKKTTSMTSHLRADGLKVAALDDPLRPGRPEELLLQERECLLHDLVLTKMKIMGITGGQADLVLREDTIREIHGDDVLAGLER
jgi:hypothetical protein